MKFNILKKCNKRSIKVLLYIVTFILFLFTNIEKEYAVPFRTYEDMYYQIYNNNNIYYGDEFYGGDSVLIDRKGNKVLDLVQNEEIIIIKDLKTKEPKLLAKIKKNIIDNVSDKKLYQNNHYNPKFNYDEENLMVKLAPYWWYHDYNYDDNICILKNRVRLYDLQGNDLKVEFHTFIENFLYGSNYEINIYTFDNKIVYVSYEDYENHMYMYDINNDTEKLLGNFDKMEIVNDKIFCYQRENFKGNNKKFYNKSSVGIFSLNFDTIYVYDTYQKIDSIKIDNKDYYVISYNKYVKNNNNDKIIRFANFLDDSFNKVFGKDIFIDYEDIKYNFDYEKIFKDNIGTNTNFSPINNLVDTNEINLIIELKNEKLYMIKNKNGYAICDENGKILGKYFDKPIYIHNISDTRDKLIFSYLSDNTSYFCSYALIDDYELDVYYDEILNKGYDDLNEYIRKEYITRNYFYIKNDNKVNFIENIEDMVVVCFNIDGFYQYYPISGNNGYKYLRQNKNDISSYYKKIYDTDGNIFDVKCPLTYLAELYRLNDKYYITNKDVNSYKNDNFISLYDFSGNELLYECEFEVFNNALIVRYRNNELFAYDYEFKEIKDFSEITVEKNSDIKMTVFSNQLLIEYEISMRNGWEDYINVYDKELNLINSISDDNILSYTKKLQNIKETTDINSINVNGFIIRGKYNDSISNDRIRIYKNYNGKYNAFLKTKGLENYKYLDFYNDDYVYFEKGFKYGLIDINTGNVFCEFSIFSESLS